MLIFLTGFAASIAHVVTGPDHLAAVTPPGYRQPEKVLDDWFLLGFGTYLWNAFYWGSLHFVEGIPSD